MIEPQRRLGNIQQTHLIELIASDQQLKFGRDKFDTLPQYCLECNVRFACHGACPKDRFCAAPRSPQGEVGTTPGSVPGLNYLCAGYKMFFQHVDRPMQLMVRLLRQQRVPADVMRLYQRQDQKWQELLVKTGRNDPCPCGSGQKFKQCHGGLGGEQTDAFLLHPGDMSVPATTNSADVFAILNARRGTPAAQIAPKKVTAVAQVDAWAPSTLGQGLAQGKVWIGRMLRALVLDRNAYEEVARDPYMTGPALLIGLIGLALSAITPTNAAVGSGGNTATIVARIIAWPLVVLFLLLAARLLGGTASYTSTFRVTGFAYFGYWLTLLSVVPAIGPLFRVSSFILAFLGVWLGAAQAQNLRGWRTLVLPVVFLLVIVFVGVVLRALLGGAAITIESLLQEVGL